jgi:hypothetical protein
MESKQIVGIAMEALSVARKRAIDAWELAWLHDYPTNLVRLAENADFDVHQAWGHFCQVTR